MDFNAIHPNHPTQRASAVSVAQAVSFAVDEVQEFGTADDEMGLFLIREGGDLTPESDLRVTEVGAELHHDPNGVERFTVTTSDGRTFRLTVAEEVAKAYGVNPETGESVAAWTDSAGNPQEA